MKKGTYFIAKNEQGKLVTETVKGYLFEYEGLKLGVTKRSKYNWVITELTTGYDIGLYPNKKKEVLEMLDVFPDYIKEVKEALNNPKRKYLKEAIAMIAEAYKNNY